MATSSRKTPAKKRNQPKIERDENVARQVEQMATLGVTQKDIAVIVGMGETLLKRTYKKELNTGATKAKVAVLSSGYRMSVGAPAEYDARGRKIRDEIKPDKSVLIFMMKARCGLRETTRLEHTGRNGGPIKTDSKSKVVMHIAPEDLDV